MVAVVTPWIVSAQPLATAEANLLGCLERNRPSKGKENPIEDRMRSTVYIVRCPWCAVLHVCGVYTPSPYSSRSSEERADKLAS
jgi:hypothetical protein